MTDAIDKQMAEAITKRDEDLAKLAKDKAAKPAVPAKEVATPSPQAA